MRINKLPEPAYAPQPPRFAGNEPARTNTAPCAGAKMYKRCHGA